MTLNKTDLAELKRAKRLLENPGLAAKLSSYVGSPVDKGMKMLPAPVRKAVMKATETALMKALDVAVSSLGEGVAGVKSSDKMHKLAAAASGAAGGAFGLLALSWELPMSTTLMLRSVADIAASEGENPRHLETKLACLEVFALGSGSSDADDATESGYFAARAALASAVSEAAKYLAEKSVAKSGAPALVRLVGVIAARFGIVVSEKAAAQAVPIIGAAGGALINTVFIGHYQDMARGHFIVRRLEKIHGPASVRLAYRNL
jgi:hypothetical protein